MLKDTNNYITWKAGKPNTFFKDCLYEALQKHADFEVTDKVVFNLACFLYHKDT